MLKFEKILSDNGIGENDADLPSGIKTRIDKIRQAQKELADADGDEKAKLEEKIGKMDDEIMKTLPEHFEMIDEEAEEKAEKERKRLENEQKEKEAAAKKQQEKELKEKQEKETTAKKAQQEKELKERQESEAAAARKKQEEEDAAPANSDFGALEKLYKKGKTTVTIAELKAAGFNTGMWGNIGPNGCTVGRYRIFRDDPYSQTFQLSAK